MLWNPAYQDDLNKAAGQKQGKTSHQIDPFDEYEHDPGEYTPLDPDENDSSPYSVFQSTLNSPEPQKPTKIFFSTNFGENFLRLQRR